MKTRIVAMYQDSRQYFANNFVVVHEPEINLEEAMKNAVTEWIQTTPEGKKAWEESCHDFNYGDLLDALIPASICQKYGFTIEQDKISSVLMVEHDTILFEGDE